MNIRPLNEADIPAFAQLRLALNEETDFLLYESGEQQADMLEKQFLHHLTLPDYVLHLVAETEGEMIGFCSLFRGMQRRRLHAALIVIALKSGHWGKGIGTALLEKAQEKAQEWQLYRLELAVQESNQRARRLYEKAGFHIEGTRRMSFLINGQYENEIMMAKFLGPKNPLA